MVVDPVEMNSSRDPSAYEHGNVFIWPCLDHGPPSTFVQSIIWPISPYLPIVFLAVATIHTSSACMSARALCHLKKFACDMPCTLCFFYVPDNMFEIGLLHRRYLGGHFTEVELH